MFREFKLLFAIAFVLQLYCILFFPSVISLDMNFVTNTSNSYSTELPKLKVDSYFFNSQNQTLVCGLPTLRVAYCLSASRR